MLKKTIFVCFVLLLLTGCGSKSDTTVFLSPELKEYYGYYPSLEVDIVGVNENEKTWIQAYELNKYFQPNNPLRKSIRPHTIEFSATDTVHYKEVSRKIKEWKLWKRKGATDLLILANLPGVEDDNARKVMIEIPSSFSRRKPIYIEITPSGMSLINKKPEYIED